MPVRQLVREMTAESAPNPLFQAVRRRLDPLSSPWTAHPVWFATYCLSVWVGRVLLVGDSQVAATWPAVGIAFGWLMPYVADRANYRKAPFWAVVAVIVLASGIIATTTGQRTPLGTVSGVSGTIAAVATAELYLTPRGSRRRDLIVTADLVRYVVACLLGVGLAWLVVPGVGLLTGSIDLAGSGYWYLRNLSSLIWLGLLALVVLGDRRRYVAREASWPIVPVAVLATATAAVGLQATELSALFAFGLLLCAVIVSSLMSVLQCYGYFLVMGAGLVALTVTGKGPYPQLGSGSRAAILHLILVIALIVSVALTVDREERAVLFEEIARDRRRLADQSTLLRTILGSMNEGVLVLESDGTVRMRNQAAVGLLTGELTGAGRLADASDDTVLPREGPPSPPTDLVLRDGTGAPVRTVSVESHLLGPVASGAGSVAILRDVTRERRQISALRTFARVAAHDLKQPLAAIGLWVDTLRDQLAAADGSPVADSLDQIADAADRMDTLLADLLQYSLARDGNLEVSEFDLQSLITEVADHRLRSEVDRAPRLHIAAPVRLRGDRALIRQVVDNVLGNALKYRPEGVPAEVEVTASETVPGYVTLTVADRGIGVPAGQEALIFEEFHRVPTAASLYPGTGLGLAISRRVVERHRGSIRARQRPGGGTCVDITLPC